MSEKTEQELIKNGERADELQFKGLRLIQSPASFCFGTDAVLLTHYMLDAIKCAKRTDRIVELGSGTGFISVMLAATRSVPVTAVEIDAEQCSRLERSVALNSHEKLDITVINADFTKKSEALGGLYDLAVSNPPYFKASSGGTPQNAGSTHEISADIFAVCAAASRLLKFGGKFFFCFPAERLGEAFAALNKAGMEAKSMRLVKTKLGARAYLVLIRAVKGGKCGLIIENELIIHDENGSYTSEVESWYNEKRD